MSGPGLAERAWTFPSVFLFPPVGALIVGGLLGSTPLIALGVLGVLAVPMFVLLLGDAETIERWWGEETAERLEVESSSDDAGPEERDAYENLKRRYANGELDEDEFERRLQTILDANSASERANVEPSPPSRSGTRAGAGADPNESTSPDRDLEPTEDVR